MEYCLFLLMDGVMDQLLGMPTSPTSISKPHGILNRLEVIEIRSMCMQPPSLDRLLLLLNLLAYY